MCVFSTDIDRLSLSELHEVRAYARRRVSAAKTDGARDFWASLVSRCDASEQAREMHKAMMSADPKGTPAA